MPEVPVRRVTFDVELTFAADALKAAFGLPRVPVPIKLAHGRAAGCRQLELAALAIALRAVAALTPREPEAASAAS